MVGCCRASVEPISGTWLGHPLELNRPLVGAEFVPFAAPAVPDDGTSLAGGGMRLQSGDHMPKKYVVPNFYAILCAKYGERQVQEWGFVKIGKLPLK